MKIETKVVVDKFNEFLSKSTCPPAERRAVVVVLEDILQSTGNYHGFTYLSQDEVPSGQLPGIRYIKDKHDFWMTDSSRRHYFKK